MSGEVHSAGLPGLGFVKNSNKYKALQKKYDDLKDENEKLTKEKEEINAKFHEMDARIYELKGENDQLKMEIDGLKKKNDLLEEENDELNGKNDQSIGHGWKIFFTHPFIRDIDNVFIINKDETLKVGGGVSSHRGMGFLASILEHVSYGSNIRVWIERGDKEYSQDIDKSLLMRDIPEKWFTLGGEAHEQLMVQNYSEEETIIGRNEHKESEIVKFQKDERLPVQHGVTLILRMMDPRNEDPELEMHSTPWAVRKKEMINIVKLKHQQILVDGYNNPYVVYF